MIDPHALYIAGPMSGLPDHNYPAFHAAEKQLVDHGYVVLNPARTEGREHCETWLDYMRASLRDIADCDGIARLDGWLASRGARIEVDLADALDIPHRSLWWWLNRDPVTLEAHVILDAAGGQP